MIIGRDVDEAGLRKRLDACLLDDAEMALGIEGWQAFADPFAPWTVAEDQDSAADEGACEVDVRAHRA